MNCAHQGPLPRPAQLAALEALEMKTAPARIPDSLFAEVPERLRATLARLIRARPEEIALANSTSYGFNLLAQGLPWRDGDEILCIAGDFPATVVPWLPLERRGVRIRLLKARGARVEPEQLAEADARSLHELGLLLLRPRSRHRVVRGDLPGSRCPALR